MKYVLKEIARRLPQARRIRRERLSYRLHRMFFMDALEGQLDVLVRSWSR